MAALPNILTEDIRSSGQSNLEMSYDGKKTNSIRKIPQKREPKDKPRTERLLQPRRYKTMVKVFPVDDDEVEGYELGDVSMGWASRSNMDEEQERPLRLVDTGETTDRDGIKDLFYDDDGHPNNMLADGDAFAPYGFIIICLFLVAWGIVGTIQTVVLIHVKPDSMEFLSLDKNFTTHPSTYLLLATTLSILSGILGLVAILYDKSSFLGMIPHFLWAACVFALASGITANGSASVPTISTYTRLFEAVVLHKVDPTYLKEAWPRVKPDIWDRIQHTMKCCGLEDAIDWLKVPENPQIPSSCCSETKIVCQKRLDEWMVNKTVQQLRDSFSEVRPILYVEEYTTWDGQCRLAIFRATNTEVFKSHLNRAFWSMFVCTKKCRRKKEDVIEAQSFIASESHMYNNDVLSSFSAMSSRSYLGNAYNLSELTPAPIKEKDEEDRTDMPKPKHKSINQHHIDLSTSTRSSVQIHYIKNVGLLGPIQSDLSVVDKENEDKPE